MNFGPDIVHDAQTADSFDQLVLLQLVRRPRHDVNVDAPVRRPHQPLDDHRVLITLVLQPEGFLGRVDERRDAFASVVRAPDEVRFGVGLEWLLAVQSASKQFTISATSILWVVTTA